MALLPQVLYAPIPGWVEVAIDEWAAEARSAEGKVFRAVNEGDRAWGDGVTAQAV